MSNVEPINFPVMNLPIPTAWSNALSYMEMIGKLVNKMNEIIKYVDDVVSALPIDYNLQQISENISDLQTSVTTLNTIVGTETYTSPDSLNERVTTDGGRIILIQGAIGWPYTNLTDINTRLNSLESAE